MVLGKLERHKQENETRLLFNTPQKLTQNGLIIWT